MSRLLVIPAGLFVLLSVSWTGAEAQQAAPRPRAAIAVWDTVRPSSAPLEAKALSAKEGWAEAPSSGSLPAFKGDAVVSNGRLLLVVRKQSPAIELYAARPKGAVARLDLQLTGAGGEPLERLDRVALVEASKAVAALEVSGKGRGGDEVTARLRLKRGDVAVQVEPAAGAGRLRVECPGRYVVLPDFFADDIVVDARSLRSDKVELPSDNFVLHLAGQGDGLALCVFENRQQDVRLTLAGEGVTRTVAASEIAFEGKKIWIALLDGARTWHAHEINAGDAGKILPLDWTMPFPAQWRIDFTRNDGLIDSWEMLLTADKGLGYIKPSWLAAGFETLPVTRQKWNTVLGSYSYPCWTDRLGKGYIQPLKNRALKFNGPLVLYPINRVQSTPLDAFTVVDVMRNTLGVGPCEYILDLEGQKSEYKGRATCGVRDALTPIYAANAQVSRRDEVNRILDEGLTFVKHIRGRITRYVDFGHAMRAYLAEQTSAHPELGATIDELDKLTAEIDARVAARVKEIKTPAHVAAMNEAFRKDVLDDESPAAVGKCKAYTQALVLIGGSQDELAGECRWVVKSLRQKAALITAQDPRVAPVAAVIRTKTQEVLRNPAGHEGAHH
jgi:hypothetical protein